MNAKYVLTSDTEILSNRFQTVNDQLENIQKDIDGDRALFHAYVDSTDADLEALEERVATFEKDCEEAFDEVVSRIDRLVAWLYVTGGVAVLSIAALVVHILS